MSNLSPPPPRPNDHLNPTKLTKANIFSPSKNNVFHQYNNPIPGSYDPRNPNDPLSPTELTKINIYRPSNSNIFHQYNDPKAETTQSAVVPQPVATQSAVVQHPVTGLPIRRRPRPRIAPLPTPNRPAEYTSNAIIRTNGGKRHTKRKSRKHKRTNKRRN